MNLSGNTILITGGSSGIGLALSQRFLAEGNRVLITGRDAKKLEAIRRTQPAVGIFCGDLSTDAGLHALVHFVKQEYPQLNILVNNAAVQYNYLFMETPDAGAKIDYEISTNLSAPIKLTGLLLPLLTANANAAIVNVSSGLFLAPKKTASVYCATKAALHSYSKTLRYQLEGSGTRVFEIIPALVDTPMTEGRGASKISSTQLCEEFFRNFSRDVYESYIGKTRLLRWLSRLSPRLADRMMKEGQ